MEPPSRTEFEQGIVDKIAYKGNGKVAQFGAGVASMTGKAGLKVLGTPAAIYKGFQDAFGIDTDEAGFAKDHGVQSSLNTLSEGIDDYWNTKVGQPTNDAEQLSRNLGELVGQAPALIATAGVLKAVPVLGEMAEGRAAVPLVFQNLPSPIRAIAASSTIQKIIFGAIEGAAGAEVAPGNNSAKDWATIGAATGIPKVGASLIGGVTGVAAAQLTGNPDSTAKWGLIGMAAPLGFGASKKLFTSVAAGFGAKVVDGAMKDVGELALKARVDRPVPTNATEAVAFVGADAVDTIAKQFYEKDFSSLDEGEQKVVRAHFNKGIVEAMKSPDADLMGEIDAQESKAHDSISPIASGVTFDLDALAKKAGIKTFTETQGEKEVQAVRNSNIAKSLATSKTRETVPETDNTISAQIEDVLAGNKRAVVILKSTNFQDKIPEGVRVKKMSDGSKVIWKEGDSSSVTLDEIRKAHLRNALDDILEWPAKKEEVATKITEGEQPVTVKATNPATGTEVATGAASSSNAIATALKLVADHPASEVTIEKPQAVDAVMRERVQGILRHEMNNVYGNATTDAYMGKSFRLDKSGMMRIQLQRQAAIKAGLPEEDVDQMIAEVKRGIDSKVDMAREQGIASRKVIPAKEESPSFEFQFKDLSETLQKMRSDSEFKVDKKWLTDKEQKLRFLKGGKDIEAFNNLNTDITEYLKDKVGEGTAQAKALINEQRSSVGLPQLQVAESIKATGEEAKKSAAVLNFEKRDSGLDERDYRAILSKYGYKSSKDVPAAEREAVRNDILTTHIKRQNFYESGDSGVYTTDINEDSGAKTTNGAATYKIAPTKVLDLDTGYNPGLMKAVAKDYPELIDEDAKTTFKNLSNKLDGDEDKIKSWLVDKGYDAIKTGRMGHNEDVQVQPLSNSIVKSVTKKEVTTLTNGANAIGLPSSITDSAAKAGSEVEKSMPKVPVKKFNARGQIIKPEVN